MNVVWKGSPNYTPGRREARNGALLKPVAIVIHVMGGSLTGCDAWFANRASQVSAHYGVGKAGSVHQYVSEEHTAWHAGITINPAPFPWLLPGANPNAYTIGIENEGASGESLTPEQFAALVELVQAICGRQGIPKDREHIIGHYQLDSVTRAGCPGPAFPWQELLDALNPAAQRGDEMLTDAENTDAWNALNVLYGCGAILNTVQSQFPGPTGKTYGQQQDDAVVTIRAILEARGLHAP